MSNKQGRYVRQNLAATRDGIIEPGLEVECWVDELADLLRQMDDAEVCPACAATGGYCGGSGHPACGIFDGSGGATTELPGPQWAYDFLALKGKLRRVKPEVIDESGGVDELKRAQAVLTCRGAEIASLAISVLNPSAWMEEVEMLEKWLDEMPDPAEEVRRTVQLFNDLDEAELVLAESWRLGVYVDAVRTGVDSCSDWFCGHTGLFLAASVYVQAVGAAMRPCLADEDYYLAVTAINYGVLLDAAVAAEEDLDLKHVTPLSAAVVAGLYRDWKAGGP